MSTAMGREYLTIRDLCAKTGFCEKTIRRLVRQHGLAHHRASERGKILIAAEDFERYMRSTRREVERDRFVADILREFAEAVR